MSKGRSSKPNPRHRIDQADLEVSGEPVSDAPELWDANLYHPNVSLWWDAWCASDQAETFTETDWYRLQALAPIWDQYWDTKDSKLLAELRLQEEKFGATPRDRQNLRMTLKKSDSKKDDKKIEQAENVVRLQNAFKKGA